MSEVFSRLNNWVAADIAAVPGSWSEVGPVVLQREDIAARAADVWILPRFDEFGGLVEESPSYSESADGAEVHHQESGVAAPHAAPMVIHDSNAGSGADQPVVDPTGTDSGPAGSVFQGGYEDGFAAGQAAAVEAAREAAATEQAKLAAATAKQLNELASSVARMREELDETLGSNLTQAVVGVAAATVGYEWQRSAQAVNALVDGVLSQSAEGMRDLVIVLSPGDLELLNSVAMDDEAEPSGGSDVSFAADAALLPGQIQLRHALGSSSDDIRERLRAALEFMFGNAPAVQSGVVQFDQSLELSADLSGGADTETVGGMAETLSAPSVDPHAQMAGVALSDDAAPGASPPADANADLH